MVYDHHKEEAEREREAKKRQVEIALLCADLERALKNPSAGMSALDRQAALLDNLLYIVMLDNLRRDKNRGWIGHDNLETILMIQKQCVDTLKAATTVEYMQTLSAPRALHHSLPPPHPLENEKRTDEA